MAEEETTSIDQTIFFERLGRLIRAFDVCLP